VVEHALLDLSQAEVLGLEDRRRVGDVEVVLGAGRPRE
jgi:hypothetical protein